MSTWIDSNLRQMSLRKFSWSMNDSRSNELYIHRDTSSRTVDSNNSKLWEWKSNASAVRETVYTVYNKWHLESVAVQFKWFCGTWSPLRRVIECFYKNFCDFIAHFLFHFFFYDFYIVPFLCISKMSTTTKSSTFQTGSG